MATALGTYNPNSVHNRSLRRSGRLALPLSRQAEVRVLEDTIRALTGLREFKYRRGDLFAAGVHARKIGALRRQLRRLEGAA